MKLDRTAHPVSQTAVRVFFACLIGAALMALFAAEQNHPMRSSTFLVTAAVLACVGICSLVTYFRPFGMPAFITSTAYVGLFLIAGIFEAGKWLHSLDARWRMLLAAMIMLGWFLKGIRNVRSARQAADSGK